MSARPFPWPAGRLLVWVLPNATMELAFAALPAEIMRRNMSHIYIGVNCKKCQKPIAAEKITREQRDAQQGRVFKERELTCLVGHRGRYVSEDFHIFESSIALPVSGSSGRSGGPKW